MRARTPLGTVAVILTLLAGPPGLALASPPISIGANGLSLQLPGASQVQLQVQRPDGTLVRTIHPASALVDWSRLLGRHAADGLYSWEAIPMAAPLDEAAIWDPANGRDRPGANLPPPSAPSLARQSGSFVIRNGIFVDEQAAE